MGERRKNGKAHHHMGLDRKISRQLRFLGLFSLISETVSNALETETVNLAYCPIKIFSTHM
jgi:hypothetical protein